MVRRAGEKRFNFPYLKDADGAVAERYGAISTPHVFVLDAARRLVYRGRIDDKRDPARATSSDLENALRDVFAAQGCGCPRRSPSAAPSCGEGPCERNRGGVRCPCPSPRRLRCLADPQR